MGLSTRAIFATLHRTPPAYPFDPGACIRSVNALHRLGKQGALAAIRAYAARVEGRGDDRSIEGLALTLRCLFEVPNPPGYLPGRVMRAPSPREPADPRRIPRFPIVLIDDVPLSIVNSYAMAGTPALIESTFVIMSKRGNCADCRWCRSIAR